jgi:hypothetical protein
MATALPDRRRSGTSRYDRNERWDHPGQFGNTPTAGGNGALINSGGAPVIYQGSGDIFNWASAMA